MTLRTAALSSGWASSPATGRSSTTEAFLVGVDVGGTKIHAAAHDPARDTLTDARRPTDRAGREAVLAQVVDVVAELSGSRRPDAVVVGLPGIVHPVHHTLSEAPNLPDWDGIDAAATLSDALGRPVRVENDVNLAAWGEHAWCGESDLAFIAVGTGIGMAQVVGGRLLRGPDGSAGEVHDLPTGPPRVDLESVVSGPALANAYRTRTGTAATPAQVLAATATDPEAAAAVDHLVAALADLVLTVHRLTAPAVIVLGGGLGSTEAITGAVDRRLDLLTRRRPRVRASYLGSHAATFGALDLGRIDIDAGVS